ncbi:MAG: hypothetical protein L0215_05355 [Gemmataceae bacterium]|nr:hypothetical protein [Gemmataceae bacterium]
MNDSEIARLEEELRLSLPKIYAALVRRMIGDVAELPGSLEYGVQRPFMIGINEILSINRKVRATPQSDWPDHMFVCGFEHVGNDLYVLDCRAKKPRLLHIHSASKDPFPPSSKKLEPCSKFADLAALYGHALGNYRAFAAKERKGKRAPQRAPRPADSPLSGRKRSAIEAADPDALDSLAKLLAGFELVKPRRKHSIALLTKDVVTELPKELSLSRPECFTSPRLTPLGFKSRARSKR